MLDLFYNMLYKKLGKIKVVSGKRYSKLLKTIKEKCGKSITIKIIDNKKINWAQKPIFSSSIYITSGFWNILSLKEKLAVIFHEIGHDISCFRYLYCIVIIPFILINYFFFYPWKYVIALIWIFGRGLAATICPISILDEKFADDFVAKRISKKYLINALKKFQSKNIPLFQKIIYYLFFCPFKLHSSTEERVKRLED
jgi:Zn-dependent protease with chaperone function